MELTNRMVFALTWRGWGLLLIAPVTAILIARALEGTMLASAAPTLALLPAGMFVAGVWQLFDGAYRCWRWERGRGPMCSCGGPLGAQRWKHGRSYRQCAQCNRKVRWRECF